MSHPHFYHMSEFKKAKKTHFFTGPSSPLQVSLVLSTPLRLDHVVGSSWLLILLPLALALGFEGFRACRSMRSRAQAERERHQHGLACAARLSLLLLVLLLVMCADGWLASWRGLFVPLILACLLYACCSSCCCCALAAVDRGPRRVPPAEAAWDAKAQSSKLREVEEESLQSLLHPSAKDVSAGGGAHPQFEMPVVRSEAAEVNSVSDSAALPGEYVQRVYQV